MTKKEMTITRDFDVSREKLWQAWTDPAQLAKWWGPRGVTNPTCEVDLRVGGNIHVVMLAGDELGAMKGQQWPMVGTFREIAAPEKLVFENNATDTDGNILLSGETTLILEDIGGKTKMTLQSNAEGNAPGTDAMLAGMEQGWNESIDKLAALLLA